MAKPNAIPFTVPSCLLGMSRQYPDSDMLISVLNESSRSAREVIVRQWLTEGVPAVFDKCPALFEVLRAWLGVRLRIHPKQITLVGSARFGFSLSPGEKYGQAFSPRSDLDFAIVSGALFGDLQREFEEFSRDYFEHAVSPRNSYEEALWKENVEFGLRNIPKGFFDAKKIPLWDRYPVSQSIGQSMWMLCEKLRSTDGAPQLRTASVRAYRDWDALISRVSINLSQLSA